MKLYNALKYILTIMCLGLSSSILWVTFRYKHILEPTHIAIFLSLAFISLTPIILVIHQSRKK